MVEVVRNIHGRRAGRGLRPWLLLPKVIAIAVYLGAVAAAALLWWTTPLNDAAAALHLAELTRRIFVMLAIPALILTGALGVGLFLQMPSQFLRLRWWQVKMVSLLVGVPLGHFWVSAQLRTVRAALGGGSAATDQIEQFRIALLLLLAGSIWVIVLGRLKPNLGQNWARDFPVTEQRP